MRKISKWIVLQVKNHLFYDGATGYGLVREGEEMFVKPRELPPEDFPGSSQLFAVKG
jgi:hypothetical protein